MCGPPRYGHSWHKCLGLARIYLESFSSWEPVVRREFRRIVEPTSELGQECPPLFNALPASRRPVHRQAESLTRARLGQTPRSEADGAALVSGNSPPPKGYTRVKGEPPAIEIALTRAGLSQTVGEGGRTFVSWCYRSVFIRQPWRKGKAANLMRELMNLRLFRQICWGVLVRQRVHARGSEPLCTREKSGEPVSARLERPLSGVLQISLNPRSCGDFADRDGGSA